MWILGVLVVLCIPFIFRSIYTSQARKLLKKSHLYYNESRRDIEDQAIYKVRNNPHALLGLAEDAVKMGRDDFAFRVLDLLPVKAKWKRERNLIKNRLTQKRKPLTLEGVILKSDQLLKEDMVEAAESQIRRGLSEWPDNEILIGRLDHINRSKSE